MILFVIIKLKMDSEKNVDYDDNQMMDKMF